MIRALFDRFTHTPAGGNAEAALSHEGMSWGWAFLLLLILAASAVWAYGWGAPMISRGRRGLLTALRIFLIALFILLLVRPVLVLTINEPVRERLLVLLDTSESMEIKDRRALDEDKKRAALAAGLLAPNDGLQAAEPAGGEKWHEASRAELLRAVAANGRLNLWSRLQEKADLLFYSIGGEAHPLGPMNAAADTGSRILPGDVKGFFERLKFSDGATALGDSLRQVLAETRGQPVTGVFVVTDGANNSGTPPEEIAQLAKQTGLPLYLYGVGITAPKDIVVHELTGPRGAFVKERAEFSVKVRSSGFNGRTVKLQLKANGKKVDEQEVKLSGENETEFHLGFEPQDKGEAQIEAVIEPLADESTRDNNSATTKVRVLDSKVKVLYVESEPRWDFRYLLAALQRDRRLAVKCVLLQGDADLADEPDSPFLKEFPTERADVVSNEIIILGDVDPQTLGDSRMKLINEWVGEMGGGLIFLAGAKNDPFRYAGTPLDPLLPVEPAAGLTAEQAAARSLMPIRLKLTTSGELSPLFRLSEKTAENRALWAAFPGVRWTARVARARPNAQVFLTDTTPERAARGELMPVIAQQQYGQGMVMYFGFDETYRWRSQLGEKYYQRIWNQIMQSFALDRQLGASARTQLKTDRPDYFAGDKVVISGKIYSEKFTPLTEASVPGTLTVSVPGKPDEKSELRLLSVPDRPGEYTAELPARAAGQYSFSTIIDPKAAVKFAVTSPKLEQNETAMNAPLLQAMAQISSGKFLREEDLNGLPDLIASRSATIPIFKKIELFYSPWWMIALMACACGEWLLRRLWQLK